MKISGMGWQRHGLPPGRSRPSVAHRPNRSHAAHQGSLRPQQHIASIAMVNPNRQDESGELAHLCAAAVVFLFLVECNRQARTQGIPTPDLMTALDLVGLATVADVAPRSEDLAEQRPD